MGTEQETNTEQHSEFESSLSVVSLLFLITPAIMFHVLIFCIFTDFYMPL
jgi:hypothetical protein